MYCPKCGKQVPDNAAFCSSCGASLKGRTTNGDSKSANNGVMIGLIVIFISVILLYRAYPIFLFWDYIDFLDLQSEPRMQMLVLFFILGITGVICGIIIAVRSANEIADKNRTPPPYTPPEPPRPTERPTEETPSKGAMKIKMKNFKGLIKCSRCKAVQGADRTVCQSCGAKFVNR